MKEQPICSAEAWEAIRVLQEWHEGLPKKSLIRDKAGEGLVHLFKAMDMYEAMRIHILRVEGGREEDATSKPA